MNDLKNKKINIVLLFGGRSAEHEVSIQSARNIALALNRGRYELLPIYISRTGTWYHVDTVSVVPDGGEQGPAKGYREVFLKPGVETAQVVGCGDYRVIGRADVVFPVLHGPYGEDGTVQGLLQLYGIPFVGAGVTGSAVGMDKEVMKRLLRDGGIPVPLFQAYRDSDHAQNDFREVSLKLGLPLFVKPANLGSSVGISMAKDREDFSRAVREAFRHDRKIIVEEYIEGREVECSVLGNEQPIASVPGEILSRHEFYSYDAKYVDDLGADLVIPAKLDEDTIRKIRDAAVMTFRLTCCEGLARVDFFIRENGDILVNEINTLPGFTNISMYPKLWEATGIPQHQLVDRLVELAFERHNSLNKLQPGERKK
jgi:D-alanine-D-alanine ligase